jgi:hypothetical protein
MNSKSGSKAKGLALFRRGYSACSRSLVRLDVEGKQIRIGIQNCQSGWRFWFLLAVQ